MKQHARSCDSLAKRQAKERYRAKPGVRDGMREWQRTYYRNLRLQVIQAYGGKCVCCDESNEIFLAIDHINGRGRKERADAGGVFYRRLIRLNYPDRFQLLCHNCNWAKYRGGCPHEAKRTGATA